MKSKLLRTLLTRMVASEALTHDLAVPTNRGEGMRLE
jgi:hypothetical protein